MFFEILEIKKDYLLTHDVEPIVKFINKAYDKPKFKHKVIETRRIKSKQTFANEMSVDSAKEFILFVLLGPKTLVGREFNESFTIEDTFDCDVDIVFDPSSVKFIDVNADYNLTKDLSRVLGSVAFIFKQNDEVELTAFTSFAKGVGSSLLDVVLPRLPPIKVLEAKVIREHGLVEYYVKNCKFKPSEKPDFEFKINSLQENPFEDGLVAYRDFRIAYIYRSFE